MSSKQISGTASARARIEALLNEPGRKALLRREALALGIPERACDRAIRALRDDGRLCRFGQGVYGVGQVKLFDAAPEVLKRLGYEILPGRPVKGYSQRVSGSYIRLDRPCYRTLRARGVWLTFEKPDGKPILQEPAIMGPNAVMPSKREIEDHYHDFDYCHSFARAEKDLLVHKALNVVEQFQCEDAGLVMDGGTSLVYYHRAFSRFSEDIDIRLALPTGAPPKGDPKRTPFVKEIGKRFQSHIERELPWLIRTSKGRIRRDGVVQVFIYRYTPKERAEGVQPGLKFEIVDVPTRLPVRPLIRDERTAIVVDSAEIAAGKWSALSSRVPYSEEAHQDLVRHVHDIAVLHASIRSTVADAMRTIAFEDPNTTPESVMATLAKLRDDPRWETRYVDYLRRMGTKRISKFGGDHPPWDVVLRIVALSAEDNGLVAARRRRT